MELPSKLLEQIAFITRPKIEEHTLTVMDKSTLEEHLSQQSQTNKKQFKIAVTFLSVYNGIFNVTISINKLFFQQSLVEEDFVRVRTPIGAYELESLNDELNGLLLTKNILPKQIIHFISNQILVL